MEFSIFGVPFRCTKDMFTWEKFKWSLFIYWAQLWRGSTLAVAALFVGGVVLLIPAFLDSDALAQFNNSELDIKITMHIAYSLHYWYQQLLIPGIVLVCCWFFGLILASLYIAYYATFKKNYQSFSRQFHKLEVKSFWSCGFWKPFILTTIFGLLFGWIAGAVLGLLDVQQAVITLISFMVGLVLFHIFIHGGAWRFVPVRKQPKGVMTELKS